MGDNSSSLMTTRTFPYKTIIIDDEPPAIQRLHDLLANFPNVFKNVGEAMDPEKGVSLINNIKPDLIFLDIQMPGMSGFELLKELTEIPMIVFCTAYDQHSLKAFETNSIDYLLKPVKKERLEVTITKLRMFNNDFQPEKILSFLQEFVSKKEKKTLTSITTRKGNKLIFIKLTDIVYFEADEKYVSLYSISGSENITEQTIKELEENLPPYFLRVHRAIIVNTKYIKELQTYFNSRYTILLDDAKQTKVVSGRSYQKQIKDWMGFN